MNWHIYKNEKPLFGQTVVCLSESYLNFQGEEERLIEIGTFNKYEFIEDENGDTIRNEFHHFIDPNNGEWIDEPELWCDIPNIPEEYIK